jgi:hypothetical protein
MPSRAIRVGITDMPRIVMPMSAAGAEKRRWTEEEPWGADRPTKGRSNTCKTVPFCLVTLRIASSLALLPVDPQPQSTQRSGSARGRRRTNSCRCQSVQGAIEPRRLSHVAMSTLLVALVVPSWNGRRGQSRMACPMRVS